MAIIPGPFRTHHRAYYITKSVIMQHIFQKKTIFRLFRRNDELYHNYTIPLMAPSPDLTAKNAEKSLALASALFPGEEWVSKEPRIWVDKSRLAALARKAAMGTEHSVFVWLLSDISVGSVKAKIAGELKNRLDKGNFLCFFEHSGKLYMWTYDELRLLISKVKG
jgi:hypothetical protein